MRIFLKIMGRSLYEKLTREMAALQSAFPKRYKHNKLIDWQLILLDEKLNATMLASEAPDLSVILIDAPDITIVEQLRTLARQEFLFMDKLPDYPNGISPIIVLFQAGAFIPGVLDMPEIVSDWMHEPVSMDDLVSRLFSSMRRKKQLPNEMRFGPISLLPESRKLCFCGESAQLTAAELVVAELFLHHFGSVIVLEDIELLFKLADRSTEGSNIRVTMFQLRFKFEAVTHCQFTLMSVYREGYALKQMRNDDPGFTFPEYEARQDVAEYH